MGLEKSTISGRLWFSSSVISLSSFLFGYALAGLNTVMKTGDDGDPGACYNGNDDCPKGSMLNDIDLDVQMQQLATSMTIIGAWLGCLTANGPSEKVGRRITLLYNNIFFIVGGLFCSISSISFLFIGRFLVGLAVGAESMIAPVLLSEISSKHNRGTITTLHQLNVTVGILFAGVLGYPFVNDVAHGWKVVQVFTVFPAVLQIALFHYLPESPRWLAKQGRVDEGRKVLEKLRDYKTNGDDVEEEMQEIVLETSSSGTVARDSLGSSPASSYVTWSDVFSFKRCVMTGIILMSCQALTGINSVIFYSTTIFGFAGVSEDILATISVGAVNVIMTIVSAYLVDRKGRKSLIVVGQCLMLVSLILLGVFLLSLNAYPSAQGVLSIVAVLAYVCGFAVGPGAATWVVLSELTPIKIRSKAYGMFVSVNWAWNLVISMTTLTAINGLGDVNDDMDDDDVRSDGQKIGVAVLYLIFAGVTVFALFYVLRYVPETKGMSASQQALFHGAWVDVNGDNGSRDSGNKKDEALTGLLADGQGRIQSSPELEGSQI